MWLQLLVIFGVVLYLLRDWIFGKKPKNFPPGPTRWPIVGNLPQLRGNALGKLKEWKDEFGNIYGLRFGEFNMVVLNGYETIKEAYDRPEFSGRPALGPLILIAGKNKRGLVASEGPHWSEQRRFALRTLRDFGFGKKSMEATIQEDARELIASLKRQEGQPISTSRMLSLVVLSSLWYIVGGERLGIDDQRTKELLDTLQAVISSTSVGGPAVFMPWLAQLFPKLTGWSRFESAIIDVKSFIREKINEHKDTIDRANPRDFIDVFLNEMAEEKDKDSSFFGIAGEEHILVSILNLFGAGAETTSNTLNWAFYLLAQNTEAQDKMHKELDQVVGRKQLPSLDDKAKLPYTEAVMNEVFRKSTIAPFGVFHSTLEDTKFQGYSIPKGTATIANLYDLHHDPKKWTDPDSFKPERFLSADEKTVVKPGPLLPFLVGKRACLGETLARSNFYLILTAVIQRFDITFDPNTPHETSSIPSLFRFPPSNKLIFKDRYE